MRLIVVSVYDVAAGAYGRPAFVTAKGAAIRSFQDEVNRSSQDNVMFHHPEHFQLFVLGEWDDGSGEFSCGKPVLLAQASDVKSSV